MLLIICLNIKIKEVVVVNRQQFRKLFILISFLLFPITMYYFSPVIIIFGAAQGIIAGSFIMFVFMFLAALFFGRIFCSWLCPAAGLQEMCMGVTAKTVGSKYDLVKYFLWVPWIGTIIALFIFAGGVHSIDPLMDTISGISIARPDNYIIFYFFISLILIAALTAGRRGFCHYVCWMAPFMIIGDKLGNSIRTNVIRLKVDKEKCINCKICTRNCIMSLPVEEMVKSNAMDHTECILCGMCVDTCPKKAIFFEVGWKLIAGNKTISKGQ